jgi:hypothetical protein
MFLFCYILTVTIFRVNIDLKKKTFTKTWWASVRSSDCRKIAVGGFFQNLQIFADFADFHRFCGFCGFCGFLQILVDFGGFWQSLSKVTVGVFRQILADLSQIRRS